MSSLCGLEHLAHEVVEVARLVGIAGDGGGFGGLLEQCAQGLVGLEVAGLDDQRGRQRAAFDKRLEQAALMRRPAVARIDLAPAEHRHGPSSTARRSRIVLEVGVVEAQDLASGISRAAIDLASS